ncbi:class I SAM-dependent methyltransferase [Haloglomus litoreum]|uniref:class I SAM-dependent methyltransferase n=1 Tax=Haloglomus litoreum TaxID=3034026 RepID=UPI0023E7F92F|nr:class I SAM-dependent methyltransferase [Haloglomus sp. DT116]
MTSDWDAGRYDSDQSFVAAYGTPLVDLLDPAPGERVLDLGCGTGDLTATLAERVGAGGRAVGVDRSASMVARARARHDDPRFVRGDLRSLPVTGADGALSNAALHWVPASDQDRTLAAVARALRPGGRFVAELGGTGNVAGVVRAANLARREHGHDPVDPWYFPSVGEYTPRLERAGFEVHRASLFDRPTELDGADGLSSWLAQFGDPLFGDLPDRETVAAATADRLRDERFDGEAWTLDYRRLRLVAVRE